MSLLLASSVLDPLYTSFGAVLAAYFSVVKSYGLAIALLTVTVRVFLIPLTAKQVRSQQAMAKLQPEMKRIQAKYKNDRQKLNEEMMALYKEHGANPLSGCLPIILQMPLFLVLYRLVHDLTPKRNNVPLPPKHLPEGSEMYKSLVESGGKMASWGMDLAEKAGSVQGGLGKALPYYILIALVVATGYYQQRQMAARTPRDAANSQMMMVMKIFPVFFGFISLQVPAGVVVYFVTSNLWQIGQQAVTFRTNPPAHLAASSENDKDADKGKPDKNKAGADGDGPGDRRLRRAKAIPARATPSRKAAPRAGGKAAGVAKKPAPGRAQPKKPRPDRGGRPETSPRPRGLPSRFRGSSNGQAQGTPENKGRGGRKDS